MQENNYSIKAFILDKSGDHFIFPKKFYGDIFHSASLTTGFEINHQTHMNDILETQIIRALPYDLHLYRAFILSSEEALFRGNNVYICAFSSQDLNSKPFSAFDNKNDNPDQYTSVPMEVILRELREEMSSEDSGTSIGLSNVFFDIESHIKNIREEGTSWLNLKFT